MADEQDVFISGISGSIAQWSTEATASKIAGTLKQISTQNASILGLLNAVKSGEQLSAKQLARIKADIQTNTKIEKEGQKAEATRDIQAQGWFSKMSGGFTKLIVGNKTLIDEVASASRERKKEANTLKYLMEAGYTKEEAEKTIDGEKQKKNFEKMAAVAVTAIGALGTVQEATKTGFSQRFDMASELRQSGLMNGIGAVNEGMISIAKTVSETGFTFGQAAEFTKDFSKTVGILGVKSTLDFVNSMARTPGGLMEEFAMEFGQVAHISGEYLDSLRIAGQLQGRSDRELKDGMESFMSNVQATSNVLKISMEQAATVLKNSLGDAERGMLLTLPKAMQDSIGNAMKFAGGLNNPLTDLLASRLGAGSDQSFVITSAYQDTSQTPLGMEMIKFVNEAAAQLENGGDAQFQSFMATGMPAFVEKELERYSGGAARGLALSDERMLALLAQMNELAQNMREAAQGISGGDRADAAERENRDQQVRAVVKGEGAMNAVMDGFIVNLEKLTASNELTATAIANSITSNANLIDTANNMATTLNRSGNLFSRAVLGFANAVGSVVTLGTGANSNADFMQYTDFISGKIGDETLNKNASKSFTRESKDLISALTDKTEDGKITAESLQGIAVQYEALAEALITTKGGTEKSTEAISLQMSKTLSAIEKLISTLNTQ